MQFGVPDDAAFSYRLATDLKLRLHQNHELTLWGKHPDQRWKNERDRDEADVANDQLGWLTQHGRLQESCVDFFVENHSGVRAQPPIDLSGAGVYGMHPHGSVLQQAIRESAGGSAHVQANAALNGNAELGEGRLEFQAAAGNV